MNLSSIRSIYINRLSNLYNAAEIESIYNRIISYLLNYSKIDIHRNLNNTIDTQIEKKIFDYLDRLCQGEPLQYILGFVEFYELVLNVDNRVLIPRPETEFLVDLILKEQSEKKDLKVIDLCTGSGCIAVVLAKKLKNAKVTATDISLDALSVARINAEKNQVNIHLINEDLLSFSNDHQHYNLIVSNPPYVRESEKKAMHVNILDFEPSQALFVTDADPLIFYNAIACFGIKHLAKTGKIYTEINEHLGKETQLLFKNLGYHFAEIKEDINGKDRFLIAQL